MESNAQEISTEVGKNLPDTAKIPMKQIRDNIFISELMSGKPLWKAEMAVADPESNKVKELDKHQLSSEGSKRLNRLPKELKEQVETYTLSMAPKALKSIENKITSKDEKISLAASKDILDRAGFKAIEKTHQISENLNVNVEITELNEDFAKYMMDRTKRKTG